MAKVEYTREAKHGIPAGVKLTPMMRQYVEAKALYPEALLFFRMGDFYELFFRDATLAGQHLGLTVTSRNKGAEVEEPMSGFPHHQLSSYLARALETGFKVAVCDQLEDAALARGLVERGITQVITPGVNLDGEGLDAHQNNFLGVLSVSEAQGDEGGPHFALSLIDVTAGLFRCTELIGESALRCELSRTEPSELLYPSGLQALVDRLKARFPEMSLSLCPDERFEVASARRLLRPLKEGNRASASVVEEFGFQSPETLLSVAGAALAYVIDTQKRLPDTIRSLSPYRVEDGVVLDEVAIQNLELFKTLIDKRRKGSLLGLIDRALTPMGGRRIREWLSWPLRDPAQINDRLDCVEHLFERSLLCGELRTALREIGDLERLGTRASMGKSTPRELAAIRQGLEQIPRLRAALEAEGPAAQLAPGLQRLLQSLDPLDELTQVLRQALSDAPPAQLKEGGVIRTGFSKELDELVTLGESGRDWILGLEQRERTATGIGSLKVRYNRVFGYYIEVSKANLAAVPDHYIRKQTLTNGERYFTEELKDFEDKVLNAEGRRAVLEAELFGILRQSVGDQAGALAQLADALAALDVFTAFAELARQNNYRRPIVDDGDQLEIIAGRHPVVEASLGREGFIPNDISLDRQRASLLLITGPNMAGKSTIMRQVALITLLAQIGSFVPAESAKIGVVDRIFTRVGAADDLASGRSTFMVEMNEAATILREASARSLVILDEIGRGTSTHDGFSIAWAVAEYLHDQLRCRALFATHYHELTALAEQRERCENYSVAVRHEGEEMLFLHQLIPGAANRSYGIQVAKLAGLPVGVIERASMILRELEGAPGGRRSATETDQRSELGAGQEISAEQVTSLDGQRVQLNLFTPPPVPSAPSEAERALGAIDPDSMTPMEALSFLHALVARLRPRGRSR
ncbi:MAG: DNA mismatch repair protein MutS [Myxococcota bacterium]|nr:DNA mismatch repair protein MutS [Myxococcota bacterium]